MVEILIANYKYHNLTKSCVESVRKFYKTIPITIVDDGSDDVEELRKELAWFGVNIIEKKHFGHGIAFDAGFKELNSNIVITLDHDVEFIKNGAVEYLVEKIKDGVVGVGPRRDNKNGIPYIDCCFAAWDRVFITDRNISFSHLDIKGVPYSTCQLLTHRIPQFGGKYEFIESNGFYSHKRDQGRYSTKDYDYKRS